MEVLIYQGQSSQIKNCCCSLTFSALLCLLLGPALVSGSPHRLKNLTWIISNTMTGKTINITSQLGLPGTWFPTIHFDLCDLLDSAWDHSLHDAKGKYGCDDPAARSRMREGYFYVCPGSNNNKGTCGGPRDYFCASWDCVSTGHISWTAPVADDLIKVTKAPGSYTPGLTQSKTGWHGPCEQTRCNPITLEFTSKGKETKQQQQWINGMTWGLRLYVTGGDPGVLFTVRLYVGIDQGTLIGPTPAILPPAKAPPPSQSPSIANNGTVTGAPIEQVFQSPQPMSLTTGPLSLLDATFRALNGTYPNLTAQCWFCLTPGPPFYDGLALLGTYSLSADADLCRTLLPIWRRGLALTQVFGQGLCVTASGGVVPSSYQHLCNSTQSIALNTSHPYAVSAPSTWWACTSGLTTCLHSSVLNQTDDFCVLVQLLPHLYYRTDLEMEAKFSNWVRPKRAIGTTPVVLTTLLGIRTATATGLGVSALILQDQNYRSLQWAIDVDIQALEKSVWHLEDSLSSLAELVLQNRRKLGLLLLAKGELCVILGEQCCFYVNHSGVIKQSLAEVRRRLKEQDYNGVNHQNWYESLFSRSPWLTSVISAVTGSLFVFLLALTCRPCILNALSNFIKARVQSIQIMVLRTQYSHLNQVPDCKEHVLND